MKNIGKHIASVLKPKSLQIIILILLAWITISLGYSWDDGGTELDGAVDGIEAVLIIESGMANTLSYMRDRGSAWGLTAESDQSLLDRTQREEMITTWASMLDYLAQLDYIMQLNRDFTNARELEIDDASFTAYYLAFVTQYRYALEYMDLVEHNKFADAVLNEAAPSLGLAAKSYAQFKFHYANVAIATEFVALDLLDKAESGRRTAEAVEKIESSRSYLYKMGRGRGLTLTLSNAVKIVRNSAFSLWYPVQKGGAELIANRKVWRRDKYLINEQQIADITSRLRPGDIIFQRREWTLTNAGIPGFWTHSVIFIGDVTARERQFEDDETEQWVRSMGETSGRFEVLLKSQFPAAYDKILASGSGIDEIQIIESLKAGVILTTPEHSFASDGLAALRPLISTREKAQAIFRSFQYLGRPYDYNFDFLTDSSLVCSEIIYKAYEPTADYKGVRYEMADLTGRIIVSPNQMVKAFDAEFSGDSAQLEFVLFYDGIEPSKSAVEADVGAFRESWSRPDWHIFFQEPTGK